MYKKEVNITKVQSNKQFDNKVTMPLQKNGKRPKDKQQYTKHTTEQHAWNTQLFNICILFRILIYFMASSTTESAFLVEICI